jgi:O-Antigen ligase
MTNPNNAIRLLVVYLASILLAVIVGYMLTDPLDYGSMGVFGIIALVLLSPILIKWHYPILLIGLSTPAYCFFLKGDPPLWEVVVILSFSIAIIERTISSQRRFISPSIMVWPLLFTFVMAYMTAKLTGGIGFKTLGGGEDGSVGGGKKYLALFLGIACFFALTSQAVPQNKRKLYLILFFLPGVVQLFGDLYPFLPGPLKYINLFIPPSGSGNDTSTGFTSQLMRFGGFSAAAGCISTYMVAKYGLRGILTTQHPGRFVLFSGTLFFTMVGGFRITLITYMFTLSLIFFLEGLHKTKLILPVFFGILLSLTCLFGFSDKLPLNFQRPLTIFSFLKLDPGVVMDAEGSKQWRIDMWNDLLPKVPQYLLLGKGYALSAEDYEFMGGGQFSMTQSLDKSATGLAVSGDYHNGPLSTLIPFGIWGAISIVWLLAVGAFICYRNFRYGDHELKTVNTYFFAGFIWHIICFFAVFGAYSDDIFNIARTVGFSIALNWGISSAKAAVRETHMPNEHRPALARARSRRPIPARFGKPETA